MASRGGLSLAKARKVRIITITDVALERGQTASTTVYGPAGTKLKKAQVSRIRRLVRAVGGALRAWEVDSITVGMPPLTLKIRPKKK